MNSDDEFPVVEWCIESPDEFVDYAENFAEFLVKKTRFYTDDVT
jgi:hypothetical protein